MWASVDIPPDSFNVCRTLGGWGGKKFGVERNGVVETRKRKKRALSVLLVIAAVMYLTGDQQNRIS